MLVEQENFGRLMQRIREGSEEAAKELVENYGPHILRIVRRKLRKELRSKFDSDDFVQAVWASVFARREEVCTFDRPEAMAAYLAALARNKVVEEVHRRFKAQKRDLRKERPLELSASFLRAPAGIQPTPSQVAVAKELWNQMIHGQPSQHRRILSLRRQGATYREIAQQLGLDEAAVRRVIQKISLRKGS